MTIIVGIALIKHASCSKTSDKIIIEFLKGQCPSSDTIRHKNFLAIFSKDLG
ncbi:hypothetical protein [Helicobacter bizzozeronii]|uniref:hypothetical protein n=1 Tax=Helicobacter bizzozeronii TaxID=56877 RepID=UPI0013152F38|nr:hypothetical protein [Helicobacter bizzozeronii]